jgi:hypothetical protein
MPRNKVSLTNACMRKNSNLSDRLMQPGNVVSSFHDTISVLES